MNGKRTYPPAAERQAWRDGVRAALAELGWRQPELAHKAGISKSRLTEFLCGRDWPPATVRAAIAQAITDGMARHG